MVNGDFFSIQVPRLGTAVSDQLEPVIADGCSSNNNYYTSGISRGTCCCDCDKDVKDV